MMSTASSSLVSLLTESPLVICSIPVIYLIGKFQLQREWDNDRPRTATYLPKDWARTRPLELRTPEQRNVLAQM
jgi:hypothetical protein